jgi:hypothetical protein
LLIAELLVLNESKMTRFPPHAKRPRSKSDRHAPAIMQAASLLLDANPSA